MNLECFVTVFLRSRGIGREIADELGKNSNRTENNFFFEEKKQKSGRTTREQRGKQTQRGSSDAPSHPDL